MADDTFHLSRSEEFRSQDPFTVLNVTEDLKVFLHMWFHPLILVLMYKELRLRKKLFNPRIQKHPCISFVLLHNL